GALAIGLAQALGDQAAFDGIVGAGWSGRAGRCNHVRAESGLFAGRGLALAFGQGGVGAGARTRHRAYPAVARGRFGAAEGLVGAAFLAVDDALALDGVLQFAADVAVDDGLADELDFLGLAVIDGLDAFGGQQLELGWLFLAYGDARALGDRSGAVLEAFGVLFDGELVGHEGQGAAREHDIALVDGLLGDVVVGQGVGQYGGVWLLGRFRARLGLRGRDRQQDEGGRGHGQAQGAAQEAGEELGPE